MDTSLNKYVQTANQGFLSNPMFGSDYRVELEGQQNQPVQNGQPAQEGQPVQNGQPVQEGQPAKRSLVSKEYDRTLSNAKKEEKGGSVAKVFQWILRFAETKLSLDWFSRTRKQEASNNEVRADFLKALKGEFEARGIKGVTFANMPKEILDQLNLKDFGLTKNSKWNAVVTGGRPLTGRRIVAIKRAIDQVFGLVQSSNVASADGVTLGVFTGRASPAMNLQCQANKKTISADCSRLVQSLTEWRDGRLAGTNQSNELTVRFFGRNVNLAFDTEGKLLATVNGMTSEVPKGINGLLESLESDISRNVSFYGKTCVMQMMEMIEADEKPPYADQLKSLKQAEDVKARWSPCQGSRKATFYQNIIRSVLGEKDFKDLQLGRLSLLGLRFVAMRALHGGYSGDEAVKKLREQISGIGGKEGLINNHLVLELHDKMVQQDSQEVFRKIVFKKPSPEKTDENKPKPTAEEVKKHETAVKEHNFIADVLQDKKTWELDQGKLKNKSEDKMFDVFCDHFDDLVDTLNNKDAFDSFDFEKKFSGDEEKKTQVKEQKNEVAKAQQNEVPGPTENDLNDEEKKSFDEFKKSLNNVVDEYKKARFAYKQKPQPAVQEPVNNVQQPPANNAVPVPPKPAPKEGGDNVGLPKGEQPQQPVAGEAADKPKAKSLPEEMRGMLSKVSDAIPLLKDMDPSDRDKFKTVLRAMNFFRTHYAGVETDEQVQKRTAEIHEIYDMTLSGVEQPFLDKIKNLKENRLKPAMAQLESTKKDLLIRYAKEHGYGKIAESMEKTKYYLEFLLPPALKNPKIWENDLHYKAYAATIENVNREIAALEAECAKKVAETNAKRAPVSLVDRVAFKAADAQFNTVMAQEAFKNIDAGAFLKDLQTLLQAKPDDPGLAQAVESMNGKYKGFISLIMGENADFGTLATQLQALAGPKANVAERLGAMFEQVKGLSGGYQVMKAFNLLFDELLATMSQGIDQAVDGVMGKIEDLVAEKVQEAFGLSDEEMAVIRGDQAQGGIQKTAGGLKPKWQQTLDELAGGSVVSPNNGLGRFMLQALVQYYGSVSDVDKRAMVASLMRHTDEKSTPGQFLGALLKGAGPIMQKIMQGLPTAGMPADFVEALQDMKDSLAPIPEEIVKAQLLAMVNDSKGQIKSITVMKSLGAASVGQAFLCEMEKADGTKEKCAVKLIRPDVQNRAQREREFFEKLAHGIPGMDTTFAGDLSTILDELDLTIEADNIRFGKVYHQNPDIHIKSVEVHPLVPPSANALVLKFVEGEPLSRKMKEMKARVHDILQKARVVDFVGNVSYTMTDWKEFLKARKELIQMSKDVHEVNSLLSGLSQTWCSEAIFRNGFYHGDLHAGNLMVNKVVDGETGESHHELTVLDYGNATKLSESEQTSVIKLLMSSSARKTDVFMESFRDLLTDEGKKRFDAVSAQVRPEVERVLNMGLAQDTGKRMIAIVTMMQDYGVEIPPSIYKFAKSQIRLQDSIDSTHAFLEEVSVALGQITCIDGAPEDVLKVGSRMMRDMQNGQKGVTDAIGKGQRFLSHEPKNKTFDDEFKRWSCGDERATCYLKNADMRRAHFAEFMPDLLKSFGEDPKNTDTPLGRAYAAFRDYEAGARAIMSGERNGENRFATRELTYEDTKFLNLRSYYDFRAKYEKLDEKGKAEHEAEYKAKTEQVRDVLDALDRLKAALFECQQSILEEVKADLEETGVASDAGSTFFDAFGNVVNLNLGDALSRLGWIEGGTLGNAVSEVSFNEKTELERHDENFDTAYVKGFGISEGGGDNSLKKTLQGMVGDFVFPPDIENALGDERWFDNPDSLKSVLTTLGYNMAEYLQRLKDMDRNEIVDALKTTTEESNLYVLDGFPDAEKAYYLAMTSFGKSVSDDQFLILKLEDAIKENEQVMDNRKLQQDELQQARRQLQQDRRQLQLSRLKVGAKDKMCDELLLLHGQLEKYRTSQILREQYVGTLLYMLSAPEAKCPWLTPGLHKIKNKADYLKVMKAIDEMPLGNVKSEDEKSVRQMVKDAISASMRLNINKNTLSSENYQNQFTMTNNNPLKGTMQSNIGLFDKEGKSVYA